MSRYIDVPAIVQVLGGVFKNPNLLDDERYFFNMDDFPDKFHQIIFGSISNLHQLGAKEITALTISDYLEKMPKKAALFESKKGNDFLLNLNNSTQTAAFDYYYNRMKKMTLLRMYNEKCGLDLSWLYDLDNLFDAKKKQAQEEWLDTTSLSDIADTIDKKIANIRNTYVEDRENDFIQAGDGMIELLEKLKENPEIGYPLYGDLLNIVTRGARLKKFYLRSAATGTGKTRSMIADACTIACDEIYDEETKEWRNNGTKEPTIFISTEQEEDEIQTMMIAFLSNVDEDHIINGTYNNEEWERVKRAAYIIKNCPIYIKKLPDFSLQDIENTIRFGIREWNARYIFFDYIHSSMKILSEISTKAKVKGLREDNILFMISVRLKDICNEYGVFIMTATQLNGSFADGVMDQNALRGAKAIADKIDMGAIILRVTDEDMPHLEPLIGIDGMPNLKISIYKNRRGRYKDVLLWCKADLGVCKIKPLFMTDLRYELIDVPNYSYRVNPEGAF